MADTSRGQGRVLAMLKMQPEISTKDLSYLLVRLTEKGQNEQQKDADLSGIFNCLNVQEQSVFSEYLDRVIAALEAQLGAEEDDELFDWMEAARKRLGDEQFERLMSLRGAFGGMWGGRKGHEHFGHDFHGFGVDRHRHMHPHRRKRGSERFDPDYDGPTPDGRGGFPYDARDGQNHPPHRDAHDMEE